jgi:hypothetical protein
MFDLLCFGVLGTIVLHGLEDESVKAEFKQLQDQIPLFMLFFWLRLLLFSWFLIFKVFNKDKE